MSKTLENSTATNVAENDQTTSVLIRSNPENGNRKISASSSKKKGLDPKIIERIKRNQQEKLQREKEIEEEELRQKLREKEAAERQEIANTTKKPTKIVRQPHKPINPLANSKPIKRILYPDRVNVKSHVDHNVLIDRKVDVESTPIDDWENEFDLAVEQEKERMIPEKVQLNETKDPIVEELRAPVLCVLGHVDAGKTKLLDNLRRSNVQSHEAGGITQQLGATNVPVEILRERTALCEEINYQIPGFLFIDTPGHNIFQHLRSRGSSVCDLVILVVDIMNGLESQTIHWIKLLVERKTPFIIALNKIDLVYGWQSDDLNDIETVFDVQKQFTKDQIDTLIKRTIVQFAEMGLNVGLYYEDFDWNDYYPIVPISAVKGDGIGTLIAQITKRCQTNLFDQLIFKDEIQATVMEVKTVVGLGSTIDIILINGRLSIGDSVLVATQEGPLVTRIRSLLIPEANEELRVTNHFEQCHTVVGTRSVRIVAKNLEKAFAGFPLFLVRNVEDEQHGRNELDAALQTMWNSIQVKQEGVYIQTSTFGSLEGLIQLLEDFQIPCAGVNIGPVHRKDVHRASAQLEKDPKFAAILAFDVPIDRTAQEYANKINLRIFHDDEIYRLVKRFKEFQDDLFKFNKEKHRHLAVFPCRLRIVPNQIFAKQNPIICGVKVEEGFVKIGTPICVPSKGKIDLGLITGIQMNHKPIEIARKGVEVAIKIESPTGESSKLFGRHFDENDVLMSKISRSSVDVLETYFRDEMSDDDRQLVVELKKIFEIECESTRPLFLLNTDKSERN